MNASRPIIVFIGPSLPESGLPEGLEADLRPPAAQGDIADAVLQYGECVIGLVDGVFQGAPAVRHKEILWALSRGALVYGAASMGALRAAELAANGMQGCGLIYRWYRRYALAPDDAVAVLHTPPELGAQAMTAALIDLRVRFKHARRAGKITLKEESALALGAAGLHYTERTLSAVLREAEKNGAAVQGSCLPASGPSQKQNDALLLLRQLRDCQTGNAWPSQPSRQPFVATDAFLQDMEEAGFSLDSFSSG